MAESVMEAILDKGRVVRGWLGISLQDMTPRLAEALNVEYEHGALIGAILPDTLAAKSKLERGDIIIRINGEAIAGSRELRRYVADLEPGTEAEITVARNSEILELTISVGERPTETEPQIEEPPEKMGISVRELTESLRQRLGLEAEEGVIVAEVDPTGTAYAEGIRPGMVVKEVNRQTVTSVEEFYQAMEMAMDEESVLLLLSFRGRTTYAAVPFEQ